MSNTLSDAQIRRLHNQAFAFDFSPLGEPIVMTDRHRALMQDGVERDLPIAKLLRRMMNDRLSELETEPEKRALLRKVWEDSGVNGVQITLGAIGADPSSWDLVVHDLSYWQRRCQVSDDMALCLSADDLEAAKASGKVGIVLGMQDAAPIGSDIDRLGMLRDLGVRVVQLTVNNRNLIGDGCTEREQAGLSNYGVKVVERMNELGIIVDVSHSGVKTTLDAIELSSKPIAITHSSCKSVADHPRAKSDEQLRKLAERDGYIGILCVPFFISPKGGANMDIFMRHVAHAAEIVGPERVGIGTDWGIWTPDFPPEIQDAFRRELLKLGFEPNQLPEFGAETIPELDRWESWYRISEALLATGFSETEAASIVGGNWLDFMRRALD